MNLKKIAIASGLALVAAFSGATAGFANNWAGGERSGSCINTSTCTFGSYTKPTNTSGIGGFYVNVMERSSATEAATLGWTGTYCSGATFSGSKRISESTTNQNYINFRSKVCSFKFTISQRTAPIYFKVNYDFDF
ncbi:MAG: hypothetical protein WBB82_14200 [Limnothrix sp.]